MKKIREFLTFRPLIDPNVQSSMKQKLHVVQLLQGQMIIRQVISVFKTVVDLRNRQYF